MRFLRSLAICTFAAASVSYSSAVLNLDNSTLVPFLQSHPLALVNFCEPWFEPCQRLQPELEEAASILVKRNVSVASINCTAEAQLCDSYNVSSYPALRIFYGAQNSTRFRERRTSASIAISLLRQVLPLVSEIDESSLHDFLKLGVPIVVAYLDAADEESQRELSHYAESHTDRFLFGTTTDSTISGIERHDIPFLVLYNPKDHIRHVLRGSITSSAVAKFLEKYAQPLIGKFDMETYYDYTQQQIPIMHIFALTEIERQSIAERLARLAEDQRGILNFATIDASKYSFFAEPLGLKPDRFPALVLEDVVSGDTRPFDQNEEITVDAVEKFVEDYLWSRGIGKAKPTHLNHEEL